MRDNKTMYFNLQHLRHLRHLRCRSTGAFLTAWLLLLVALPGIAQKSISPRTATHKTGCKSHRAHKTRKVARAMKPPTAPKLQKIHPVKVPVELPVRAISDPEVDRTQR